MLGAGLKGIVIAAASSRFALSCMHIFVATEKKVMLHDVVSVFTTGGRRGFEEEKIITFLIGHSFVEENRKHVLWAIYCGR